MKKAKSFSETVTFSTVGDAEAFIRRKMANYIIWENKYCEHIIGYELDTNVRISVEIETTERDNGRSNCQINNK